METEAKLRIRMKKICGAMQALKHVTAHAPSSQEVTERTGESAREEPKTPRLLYRGGRDRHGSEGGEGRVTQEDPSDGSWQEPGDNQETLKRPQDCRELPGKK